MMKNIKCKDCPQFKYIGNTDTTGSGICTYLTYYTPTMMEDNCPFDLKPYRCGDCNHYITNDAACLSSRYDDSAYFEDGSLCPGFVDKYDEEIKKALADWALRDLDIEAKLKKVYEEFKREFKLPEWKNNND